MGEIVDQKFKKVISVQFLLENRVVTRIEDMITEDESYSTTCPHYFHRKPIGATNEKLNFDIRIPRVK